MTSKLAATIFGVYGYPNISKFKVEMNKKMSGGNNMYAPPSTIGRRLHHSFDVGNRVLMRAPTAVGTIANNKYPIQVLSMLPNKIP